MGLNIKNKKIKIICRNLHLFG